MSTEPSTESASTLEQGDEGGIPQEPNSWTQSSSSRRGSMPRRTQGLSCRSQKGPRNSDFRRRPLGTNGLIKGSQRERVCLFTNYGSRKANEIEANRRAALCFHWASLERQVRITGSVERITEAESYAYFSTRGRGSRIGAWASKQSQPLLDRKELQRRVSETTSSFADQDIPLPPFWGGYRIRPEVIEFWQGKADRLHDRLVFTRIGRDWSTERLYP